MDLIIRNNDYLANGVEKQYDYEIESTVSPLAEMDIFGVFVLVSFIGFGRVGNLKVEEEFLEAILGVVKVTGGEDSAPFKQINNDICWFYEFCNKDWDKSNELFENDKEIQQRFKAFLPIWWKIVCEFFCIKFKSKTLADWIAKRREKVGNFLEEKVFDMEQKYIASYYNYKMAYEFCENMMDKYTEMRYSFVKTILDRRIAVDKDDVKRWNMISKSTIIYDRKNQFHFVINGKYSVIQNETLLKLASNC